MELERYYKRVGSKLAILGAKQAMQPEDRDTIKHAWLTLHAMLDKNGLALDGPDEEIPDHVADPLIDMLAAILVDDFGIADPRRSAIRGEGLFGLPNASPAERRLRKVLAVPGLEVKHNEYF